MARLDVPGPVEPAQRVGKGLARRAAIDAQLRQGLAGVGALALVKRIGEPMASIQAIATGAVAGYGNENVPV